jgi:hypothetical protein
MYHKVIIFHVICTNNVWARERERETLSAFRICMCDVNVGEKKE